MKAIATATTAIEITLSLSAEEARALKQLVQNSLVEAEDVVTGHVRGTIFAALTAAGVKTV